MEINDREIDDAMSRGGSNARAVADGDRPDHVEARRVVEGAVCCGVGTRALVAGVGFVAAAAWLLAGRRLGWVTLVGSGLAAWALVRAAAERQAPRVDPVDRASDESFPASDPPSWTPTVGTMAGS